MGVSWQVCWNNAKVFSVADVKNGFCHVVLEEESSNLTTFATPWGSSNS